MGQNPLPPGALVLNETVDLRAIFVYLPFVNSENDLQRPVQYDCEAVAFEHGLPKMHTVRTRVDSVTVAQLKLVKKINYPKMYLIDHSGSQACNVKFSWPSSTR